MALLAGRDEVGRSRHSAGAPGGLFEGIAATRRVCDVRGAWKLSLMELDGSMVRVQVHCPQIREASMQLSEVPMQQGQYPLLSTAKN